MFRCFGLIFKQPSHVVRHLVLVDQDAVAELSERESALGKRVCGNDVDMEDGMAWTFH